MLSALGAALAVVAEEGPSKGYLEYQDQMGHLAVLFWVAVGSILLVIVAVFVLVVWLVTRKLDTEDSGRTEPLKSTEGEQP